MNVAAPEPGLWARAYRPLTAGLVLTVTLVAFESLAVITILPVIVRDLGGLRLYGWVTSAFFLGTIVGIVLAGESVDRRGAAVPFAGGLATFGAGLALGGAAPSMEVLVLARVLQGLGAGAIPAVAYVSIGRAFPERLRPRMFAMLSTAWVVPGLVGPAISAVIAERASWRLVFFGLLPLVVGTGALTLRSLRPVGPAPPITPGGPAAPAPPGGAPSNAAIPPAGAATAAPQRRLPLALRVAAGTALGLAGLTAPTWPVALLLIAAGLALTRAPLLALLPAGTLRAAPGLPATVLTRGMLTFAFFGADTYVPLTITAVRGRSTGFAGLAVTAATLAWTAGAWTQERTAATWSGRRLVSIGLALLGCGIATVALALLPAAPLALIVVGWAVGGFGIGLAYAPLALLVLHDAPGGRVGAATAALQLSDNLGVVLGAGLGGAAVAASDATGRAPAVGIAVAFAMTGLMAAAGVAVARRLPATTVGQNDRGAPPAAPLGQSNTSDSTAPGVSPRG